MKEKILIKNGRVVFPDKIEKNDILIRRGKITKISKNIVAEKNYKVIDATNKYVLPGGIDVHTHMELEVWKKMISSDDYRNGSIAALNGGITTFFGFAYQKKGERLCDTYKREIEKAKKSIINFKLHIGITDIQDDFEKQIKECIKKGCNTFKIHLNDPSVDSIFLYRAFKAISKYNGIAVLHCEDGLLIEFLKQEYIRKGKKSIIYHPRTRENFIEKMAIEKVISLAEKLNTKIYIVHTSTAEGADLIHYAKKRGTVYIEAETCPQYLLFTESKYYSKNGYLYSCSPSFKRKYDIEVLWKRIKDNTLRVISSDHCPFLIKQKKYGKEDFTKIPYGIPGIETLYHIILSEGRKRGLKIEQIVKLISTNPAKIFKLYPQKGVLRKDSDADILIYNPDKSFKISYKNLKTNCDYSPYEGMKIDGKIETVITMGKIAVENEKFIL